MGSRTSKNSFTEWDLIQFSNVTSIPLPMVKKIHKDFVIATQNDNTIDKKEFRRLYKKMYINTQSSSLPSALPPFFTEHELNKLSDYVFETYDFEGTGKLTFEEFAEAYLTLTQYSGVRRNSISFRDRLNFILDQNNSTPGLVTHEQAERIFNRLNRYNSWIYPNDTKLDDVIKPTAANNWESHWDQLDDGSGSVSKEKFIDYISTSNDYKRHFDSVHHLN